MILFYTGLIGEYHLLNLRPEGNEIIPRMFRNLGGFQVEGIGEGIESVNCEFHIVYVSLLMYFVLREEIHLESNRLTLCLYHRYTRIFLYIYGVYA